MNKIIIPAICLIFFLASCQKEVSVDLGGSGGSGGGGGTVGDLLVKVGSKSGSDSSTNFYEYDGSKRLIRQYTTGTSQGQSVATDLRIVRNASGIITSTIQKAPGLPDSVVFKVIYNTASGRYFAKVGRITISGFSVTDSTVYVYDASGRVVQEDEYIYDATLGLSPELVAKNQYSYEPGGNLTLYRIISVDPLGGPDETVAEITATYDTKKSPLVLSSAEGAIIGDITLVSPNNPVKFDYKDIANGGADNFILDFLFTYNSQSKPATSVTTETPGSAQTTSTYYYK